MVMGLFEKKENPSPKHMHVSQGSSVLPPGIPVDGRRNGDLLPFRGSLGGDGERQSTQGRAQPED